MQSTHPGVAAATPQTESVVTAQSLLVAFAAVPDPRRRQGTRYRLAALVALAVVAMLANQRSVLAIVQWGHDQDRTLLTALGFPHGTVPHQSTLQRLFAKLDPAGLSAVVQLALAPLVPPSPQRGAQGIAVDGKAQRGRLAADPAAGMIHALSAFCHGIGVVVAQAPIIHGAEKVEAELTVAPQVVASLDWHHRVLTGDALFCQRRLCQQVLDHGGDSLLIVRGNQPTLLHDIQTRCANPPPDADRREAHSVDAGHGRTAETRQLIASTDLGGYVDWPGHAQVFRLERTWWQNGRFHHVVRHGITSLPPDLADANRLLALKRAHWQIENRLHRPKDVVLGQDASLIHQAHGPDILAILRNLVLSLLYAHGIHSVAHRLRYFSSHPQEVVAFFLNALAQNA